MKSSTERQAEIDRRVAQELKNNQDFIYTTNQWLQKLDIALDKIKKDLTVQVAETGSKLKAQDISIEIQAEKNQLHNKSCDKEFNEYRKQIAFCLEFVKESAKKSEKQFSSLEECTSAVLGLKEKITSLTKEVDRIDQLIRSETLRLTSLINERVKSAKEELLNSPTEIPSLKSFIQDKMDVFDVNFRGLMREIEILKKGEFVATKYIEDLYTRIDKLKEGKQ